MFTGDFKYSNWSNMDCMLMTLDITELAQFNIGSSS